MNNTEQIFIPNSSGDQSPSISQHNGTTNEVNTANMDNLSNVCRICATVTELVIPIFTGDGIQNNLAEKIRKYLPIQVSEQDNMPHVVCFQCTSTLMAWHELVKCCVQADVALRSRLPASAINNQASRPELKKIKKEDLESKLNLTQEFYDTVKKVLLHYLHILNVDNSNTDMEIVCQKCNEKPSFVSIDMMAKHLDSKHKSEVLCNSDLETFIKDNITFDETLLSDQDTKSDVSKNTYVLNKINYCCPFCENVFTSHIRLVCHLNKHEEVSMDEGIKCCDTVYSDKILFIEHLQNEHISQGIERNVCRTCGIVTECPEELETHITDFHKETVREKKVHSIKNQKYIPAVCPECNKVFSNKYNMFIHLKSHSGRIISYPCNKCEKSYRTRGNLNNHMKIAHQGILNYICSFCGEAFPSRTTRDVHSRLHTGHKPYKCDFCKKCYRAKNTLDRHLEMHLNIRKYECSICAKKFRKRTHLNYHLGTHKKRSNRRCLLQMESVQ